MHATQLISTANVFAGLGHVLLGERASAPGDTAHVYWLTHRFRCDAWHQRISAHRSAVERCGTSRRTRLWHEIVPALHEILISEPLSRVIAYLSRLLEQSGRDADWGALAQSALDNHVEARHRCLNLMVFGYGLPVEQAVGLNRIRRLVEFFSDQLLSSLPPGAPLDRFAFDPKLVSTSQLEFRRYAFAGPEHQVRLQSMTTALQTLLHSPQASKAENPKMNRSVAEAALALLPKDIFDSFGVLKSRGQESISLIVDECAPSKNIENHWSSGSDLQPKMNGRNAPKKSRPRW